MMYKVAGAGVFLSSMIAAAWLTHKGMQAMKKDSK